MTAKDQTSKSDQIKEEEVVTVGYDQKRLRRGLSRVLSFENPDLVKTEGRIKRSDHSASKISSSNSSSIGGVEDE